MSNLTPVDFILAEMFPVPVTEAGIIFDKPEEMREKILALEIAMSKLPPEVLQQIKTTHKFAPGLYIREVFLPAGSILMGRIHKHSCYSHMSTGRKITATDAGAFVLSAPFSSVSPAGVKRVGIVLEHTVWTTVHPNPTNETDIQKLEALLFTDSFQDVVAEEFSAETQITMEGKLGCQP